LGIEEVRVPKARKTIKIAKTAFSSNPIETYKETIKSCKKRDTEKLHSKNNLIETSNENDTFKLARDHI
jgi:hypothetical protein